MKNKTKLFIILAITGWIRVLIIAVPVAFTWIGINGTNEGIKEKNTNKSDVLTGDLHSTYNRSDSEQLPMNHMRDTEGTDSVSTIAK